MTAVEAPIRALLLAGLLGFALAGCDRQQAGPPETTPPASTAGAPADVVPQPGTAGAAAGAAPVADTALADRVRSALQADAAVGASGLVVEASQGEVLLSGFVRDQDQVDRALRIAGNVEGVSKVTNRINVNATAGTPGYPPGQSSGNGMGAGASGGSGAAAAAADTGDSIITTKVKSALLADPSVGGTDIVVETRDGTVLLSGFVRDPAQIDRAVQVTRSVEGVRKVTNKMTVKKSY